MRNAGLEEAQAGIKIAGRNINNLRYVDDTTLMAESEEELKSLLMKVKEKSESAFNLSQTRVFSNDSGLRIRRPKYWSFSFSISPSNEHPVLISFRTDWLDLLVVQGTLKSLLQHDSSKASILWRSAFFMVLLSHPYITTGKTNHSFDRWTFVKKVMSLFLIYCLGWS